MSIATPSIRLNSSYVLIIYHLLSEMETTRQTGCPNSYYYKTQKMSIKITKNIRYIKITGHEMTSNKTLLKPCDPLLLCLFNPIVIHKLYASCHVGLSAEQIIESGCHVIRAVADNL